MTATVFQLIKAVFQAVIAWLGTIFEAVGATEYVLVFVAIAILTSAFILPLRGSRLASTDDMGFTYYQPTYKYTRKPWNLRRDLHGQKELPSGRDRALPKSKKVERISRR